ncbi:Gfo/Idh/MocA family protein [Halomontanus rarus]|uniref:Gfo/Idh/MocA family protein n=1 Tax=Halomontanus rarus TaxID=3034020 RepID=UPI0023E83911|nr:Gfo/Idh/MocA family oxidoreductase [Halovivax sp. TS33]
MCAARLAFVGIGSRGYSNLKNAYTISNQPYLLGEEPDEVDRVHLSGNSHQIYHEYAKNVPDWAEDTSDLTIEVTAVYDPNSDARSRAVELCRKNGDELNVYEDWDAFLDGDEYDAAVVSTPNYTHADVVLPLMEQGLDVFCEKPLATTLEDHDRIIDADRDSTGIFYVGFNARHSPTRAKIRRAILDGEIGELGMLSVDEVRHPFPMGHYYSQEHSGGSLLEKDCHDFDYFNWIVDADPVKVYALGGQHVFTENNDVNDHATVIYEYDNGVKASLELCLYAPFTQSGGRQQRFRGSEGVIRTTNDDGSFVICTRDERKPVDVQSQGSHGGADPLMWHDFLSCLIRGTERMASPVDAKKASAIAIGAERAIKNDRIVEITPDYNLR